MSNLRALLHSSRRMMAVAVAASALAAAPGIALAQAVVVVVNGEPITSFDVEQRTRLVQVSTQKTPSRQETIKELIDEKLKLQLLRRFTIESIDNDVDNAFAGMARRARMTPQQFAEQLAKSNIALGTLKSRIKAEMVWSQVLRGRFASAFQVSDTEIRAKLGTDADAKSEKGYDYTLRPILFVIPRGSEQALLETRRREAEALRSRFQSCEQGIKLARGLRDVAVRPPVVRSSADLSPQLREILEKTELGKLSAPEVTQQGIEVYALCGKKPSSADNAPGRREAREELVSAQLKVQGERYLKELRSQAMIEYK